MNKINAAIPQTTIKVVAKNFFKVMAKYGFQQIDYLRFCNMVLDFSMHPDRANSHQDKIAQEE